MTNNSNDVYVIIYICARADTHTHTHTHTHTQYGEIMRIHKGKVFLLYVMKLCRGNRGSPPLILCFGSWWLVYTWTNKYSDGLFNRIIAM
jgi:hypothetical protein